MNQPINDLNSIENIRQAVSFLSRVKLRHTVDYTMSLEAHYILIEKIHSQIENIILHMDISTESSEKSKNKRNTLPTTLSAVQQRKHNTDLAKSYITASNNAFLSVKAQIEGLLEKDIELGEEHIQKFLQYTGEIYVRYKILLMYVCGEVQEDRMEKGADFHSSPEVFLNTRKLIQQKNNKIRHYENSRIDHHHIDKRSYLGTSMDPLIIPLERAFHNLIHKITDNFQREQKVQEFLRNSRETNGKHFREDVLHLQETLFDFNKEYAEVIMQSPENMHIFKENDPNSDHYFKQYIEGIAPHFRMLRNQYALEISGRYLKVAPYFIRNIAEAKHNEFSRYMKLDLLKVKKITLSGIKNSKHLELNEKDVGKLLLFKEVIIRNILDLDRFKEHKTFQISPSQPWQRSFPAPMRKYNYESLIKSIEEMITFFEAELSEAKGNRKEYISRLLNSLNITLIDTVNSLESSLVGNQYTSTQKEYLRKEHLKNKSKSHSPKGKSRKNSHPQTRTWRQE